MKAGGSDFFSSLVARQEFGDIAKPDVFAPIPPDWWVIISDVVGSTRAVREGRYKEVNLAGASGIMAVNNALRGYGEIPFVFGGDGASLAVPGALIPRVRKVLAGVRTMVRSAFDLDLRIGGVPVSELRAAGTDARVCKVAISRDVSHAAFDGGGFRAAETWIKLSDSAWCWPEIGDVADADFSGLECRWQPVSSTRGRFVCLLLVCLDSDEQARAACYREAITRIDEVLAAARHPLAQARLELGTDLKAMRGEVAVKHAGKSVWWQRLQELRTLVETRIGAEAMRRNWKVQGTEWGPYSDAVLANTDHRKFDDGLRMVVVADELQLRELRRIGESMRNEGRAVFGMHDSAKALLTCLVFDRPAGNHLHFVDGAEGGYAMAAAELKQQMRSS